MAFENVVFSFSLCTSGDQTGKVKRLVDMSGKYGVLPSAGAVVMGVCRDVLQAASSSMEVVNIGIAKVYAASSYSVGDLVTTDASGRATKYTPGEGTANFHVGRLLSSSSAADDIVSVLLQLGYNEV